MTIDATEPRAEQWGLVLGLPRWRVRLRIGPAAAAWAIVALFVAIGLLHARDARTALDIMWRPVLAISSIMVLTAATQRLGVMGRVVDSVLPRAEGSALRLFGLTFVLSAATAAVLNNDSAVLLLIPIVVPLVRRLYPDQPRLLVAFSLVVFMAAGVAPLIVSNPMNMIVAAYAGVSFNTYAAYMAPICLAGWLVAFVVLRAVFGRQLAHATTGQLDETERVAWQPYERHGLTLLLGVLAAYPIVSYLGGPVFAVAAVGAVGAVVLCTRHGKGTPTEVVRTGVSWEILLFLVGVSTAALGLRHTGAMHELADWYRHGGLAGIGATSALGSALLNNHPMSLINMLAIDAGPGRHLPNILAALVGGDLGPRLLPTGSLAGLLWFASLQRVGVRVRVATFCWVGAVVTIPALIVSLAVLALVT